MTVLKDGLESITISELFAIINPLTVLGHLWVVQPALIGYRAVNGKKMADTATGH